MNVRERHLAAYRHQPLEKDSCAQIRANVFVRDNG
jgi:hypothetical protein